jgi:hypothetical protein
MRNLMIATAAAALTATAVPASVQNVPGLQTRNIAATDQRAADENPDRRICVSVELTGSRMVRRVCRTAREWEERGGLESVR